MFHSAWPLVAAVLASLLIHFLAWQYLLYRWLPKKAPKWFHQVTVHLIQEIQLDNLWHKITDPRRAELLLPAIDQHIDTFLKERLQQKMPMIAMFVGEKTLATMKLALQEELHELLPKLLQQYGKQLEQNIDLPQLIKKHLTQVKTEQLITWLQQSLGPYLKYVLIFALAESLLLGTIIIALQ